MRLACLILGLTGSLLAQVPPVDGKDAQAVRELLASGDPAKLAWGAELTAWFEHADLVPELLPLLHSSDERVQEHALDALIRMKANVPPEELKTLLPRFQDAVIILAAANQQRDLLFSMMHGNPKFDPFWVALNEVLGSGVGGKEYWAELLREWTIHVKIYVVDPDGRARVERSGSSNWCGSSLADIRPDYPARAAYVLLLGHSQGDTMLASGPHPVYYRRQLGPSGCGTHIDRDDYRSDFVNAVLHEGEPLPGHSSFDVFWRSDADYVAQVNQLRAKTLERFREITDSMIKKGLLPVADAGLRALVAVQIEDQRLKKARELPETAPWE
jgi:hypothetical protein